MQLSLFVLGHRGTEDIDRALESLSARCQRNVGASEYEVVAIDPDAKGSVPFEQTLSRTAAPLVGFLGGSPLATPRLVEQALAAARLFPKPIIAVPGYELSAESDQALDEAAYERVLSGIDWRRNAYDLFGHARFARMNAQGYLAGLLESEAFVCTRDMCEALLRSPPEKGLLTVDQIYSALLEARENRLVALAGEGCFRRPSRSTAIPKHVWLRSDRQPTLFGVIPGQANDFFFSSIGSASMHEALAREAGKVEWKHDPPAVAPQLSGEHPKKPRLSIVLVAYKSPRQIENTIYSLSAKHQWNVTENDYEIVVVENRSNDMLGEERARRLGANIRYFLRDEPGVSPAPAMNFGVSEARGDVVGILIDGARMATPRVVEHVLLASRVHPRPLIVVPGFHLGPRPQHLSCLEGYDEGVERTLLESADWTHNGYRLFDIGCFDIATEHGFLNPMLEATYLFTTKECFDEVKGLDERFDLPGGGEVNHDLFERLCRLPKTRYVVLWGEGNFHQYHGGVSTTAEDRERKLEQFRDQYDRIRGRRFRTFEREPWLLGTAWGGAHVLYKDAAAFGRIRFGMIRSQGRAEWENG